MKVLLLNGSPNEHGCTYTALCEVARALEESGVGTETLWIGNRAVRGCIGCGGCAKNGRRRCVFEDDLVNAALDRMQACDGLVVGSPVHYAAAGGSITSFLDERIDLSREKQEGDVGSKNEADKLGALSCLLLVRVLGPLLSNRSLMHGSRSSG